MSALVLIDGEHYAPVVRDALGRLPYRADGAVLIGGTEKLRGGEEYGVPLYASLEEGVRATDPEVVYDLSDEPVLGPPERMRFASRALALGVPYEGPGFRFEPPVLAEYEPPSLGIIGTGKRVGKTAVGAHAARVLARDARVVVVAIGRGGPEEPQLAERPPSLERLLEISRAGGHAASDYLEDAALAGVITVGCRRAGGGLAGAVGPSNVLEGAALAATLDPDLVLFEGSGAALPPVATRRRVLVASALQPPDVATGYLNAYRVLVSDLVVVTMAEADAPHEELRAAVRELDPDVPVIATVLRPRPTRSVGARPTAFFSTAPPSALDLLGAHLRQEHGVDLVHASSNLANRDALKQELAAVDADVFLVELKAAAIDVVAESARARGVEVVLVDNEVVPLPGERDLDGELRALADAARLEPVLR